MSRFNHPTIIHLKLNQSQALDRFLWMEVQEQGEIWEDVDGDLQFSHTMVIFREGDNYFHARYNDRMMLLAQINPKVLETHQIPTEHLWPVYSKDLTLAPDPLPVNSYIKRPCMMQYAQNDPYGIPDLFIAEARIYEILKQHPHPNIAQYFGCVVRENRIMGLCLAKYHITLKDRLNGDRPVPRDILNGIESGLKHLHELGLIHNDINPSNIMFKANDDTPVVIDFDSCGREGDKLLKAGTMGWSDESFDIAAVRNDYYGLKRIEDAISDLIHKSAR